MIRASSVVKVKFFTLFYAMKLLKEDPSCRYFKLKLHITKWRLHA